MGERFHGVQALRFAAATAVVVTHAVDLAGTRLGLETVLAGGTLENFGAVGVDVFFVISGFIIATTTQGQTGVGAAGAFLWRRFRRVAPIYWLLSLPILIGMARGGTLSPEVAAATFLFWPFSGLEMTFPALGPGWTLCFEMLFYAGFGLAIAGRAMAGGRRVGWGLVGTYAAMLAVGLVVAAPVLRFWGAPIILEFLLGVGIASVWRREPRRLGLWAVGLALVGFGLGLVFGYGGIDDVRALNDPWNGLRRVLIWGLPSALLVFGVVRMERTDRAPVRMLNQHDARAPVGVWEQIVEDARGLFVRGRIEDWSAEARFAGALSRAGALDGLSIGYRTARARRQGRLRVLSAVELWEVSLVTFPMLPGARFSLA